MNGLNWTDHTECKAWLDDVAQHIDDALDAADDQTLPLDKRRLGRVVARELLAEARQALTSQIAYARQGLDRDDGQKR
jgi:hypothetical protein